MHSHNSQVSTVEKNQFSSLVSVTAGSNKQVIGFCLGYDDALLFFFVVILESIVVGDGRKFRPGGTGHRDLIVGLKIIARKESNARREYLR